MTALAPRPIGVLAAVMLYSTATSFGQTVSPPDGWEEAVTWRDIGPAAMGGRITDIAVSKTDRNQWWVASASGGLLHTTNNGQSFEHQFDHEATVSLGAVSVAPSDDSIVWVGTGEENPRNSVSYGNGVYKSTDGGKTWKHMGLDRTFQISSIAIHPENPDEVYVGALGRLYGPNEERGLYKSTDGGESWEKVLYVDDQTGVIDIDMNPADPYTMIVATYERQRDGFDTNHPAKKWGPGSGLWKTTDGGTNFERLSNGLPTCQMGRIGVDWYAADPQIVYAIIETERLGEYDAQAAYAGLTAQGADVGARVTDVADDSPAKAGGLQTGDIILGVDGERMLNYDQFIKALRGHQAGDEITLDVVRGDESMTLTLGLTQRPEVAPKEESDEPQQEEEEPNPGEEPGSPLRDRPFAASLGGQTENLQGQQGPEEHEYGGVYKSTDGGATWTRINSVNPRPMYYSQVRVDPSDSNYIYVLGTSLYKSTDGGETFTDDGHGNDVHVDHHAMWVDPVDGRHILLGNDGGLYETYDRMATWEHQNKFSVCQFYHITVGPRDDYYVYGGLQDNGSWGGPGRSRHGGAINEDWFRIGGGDGFVCLVDPEDPDQLYSESQNGSMGRWNLRTGERSGMRPRPQERDERYRFNWETPFLLSNHNARIFYAAGNKVFKSLDKGNGLEPISPDITATERGSATALAESPQDADVLWVGTDDGALWMTEDGGDTWIDLFTVDVSDLDVSEEGAGDGGPPRAARRRGGGAPGGGGFGGRPGGGGGAPESGAAGAGGRGGGAPGGGARGGRLAQMLADADANGDGKIERSEAPEQLGRFFDRLDTNSDGTIDQDELRAAAERMRGGRGGAGGGAAAGGGALQAAPGQAEGQRGARRRGGSGGGGGEPASTEPDAVTGTWAARMLGDVPPEFAEFDIVMKLEGEAVTGEVRRSEGEPQGLSGTWSAETNTLKFSYDAGFGSMDIEGKVEGSGLKGTIEGGDGAFVMDFEATRTSTDAALDEPRAARGTPGGKRIDELIPGRRWVTDIEPSRHVERRVYLALDAHRSDDDHPYAFVSEDNGRTWRPLTGGLPEHCGVTRTIHEDIVNPDLLYLGTEFGAYFSLDRGESWTKFQGGLPTVAVHEIAQHPTRNEIVAGTHGRGAWVCDVTALRQMNAATAANDTHLYEPNTGIHWKSAPGRGGNNRAYEGENPDNGVQLVYAIGGRGAGEASLEIRDVTGKRIRQLDASAEGGLHTASWNLRTDPPRAAGNARRGRGGFRGRRGGPAVPPGQYLVVLTVDQDEYSQVVTVEGDPEYPDVVLWGTEYDEWLQAEQELLNPEEEGESGE